MTAARVLNKYRHALRSDLTIVKTSNDGVESSVFSEIHEISGIKRQFLAESIFDVSLKTMMRYEKDNKKLNPKHSEIALKLMGLFKKGRDIFGSLTAFVSWLDKPAYGLGDQVPMLLLNTITGMDLVEEELIRIEYGALA